MFGRFAIIAYLSLAHLLAGIPDEGKVNAYVWDTLCLENLFAKYNPLGTEYDDEGEMICTYEKAPVLYKSFVACL